MELLQENKSQDVYLFLKIKISNTELQFQIKSKQIF